MRTQTRSLTCPRCGYAATIILSENRQPSGEGHAIELRCSNPTQHEPFTEVELLRLWAARRAELQA